MEREETQDPMITLLVAALAMLGFADLVFRFATFGATA